MRSGFEDNGNEGFSFPACNLSFKDSDDLCGIEPVLMTPISFSGLGDSIVLKKLFSRKFNDMEKLAAHFAEIENRWRELRKFSCKRVN